jgi:D-2-hydroxyacid dehydrogenase (NADP+)
VAQRPNLLAVKLRVIQSTNSGTDQCDKGQLAARFVLLASAAGVNARAVAEHHGVVLAQSRRLPETRDNQSLHRWRGIIGDPARRADEFGGKTLLVIGLG